MENYLQKQASLSIGEGVSGKVKGGKFFFQVHVSIHRDAVNGVVKFGLKHTKICFKAINENKNFQEMHA